MATQKPKSPLLASAIVDVSKDVQFPCLASPKLDGIRCLTIMVDGKVKAVSRKLKPIPNIFIRGLIEMQCPAGLDGEIVAVDAHGRPLEFNDTNSAVTSVAGAPLFEFRVFDYIRGWAEFNKTFHSRFEDLSIMIGLGFGTCVRLVPHKLIHSEEELTAFEVECLADGHEGVMVRSRKGIYKQGRSTLREGVLLKLKRFAQAEATVIGATELMHNSNEGVRDAVGNMKRSSAKAGQVGRDTLGALIMVPGTKATKADFEWFEANKDNIDNALLNHPKYFKIGTGFDEATRSDLWASDNARHLIGDIVTYKHQESGAKAGGKPRFPVFIGFRNKIDI